MMTQSTVNQITVAVVATVIAGIALDFIRNHRPQNQTFVPPADDDNGHKWLGGVLG